MVNKYLEKVAPEGSYVIASAKRFWKVVLAAGILWSVYLWAQCFIWVSRVPGDMHRPGLVVNYSEQFTHLLLPLWILAIVSLTFIFRNMNYRKTMKNRAESYVSRGKYTDIFGISFVLLAAILSYMVLLFVGNGLLLAIYRAIFQYTTYQENIWRVLF